ncbi:MAG TPA: TetR/AcrR family transcriptional regulator [Hellea balneolensis]|uniref:TetR/AcrR family transcriptional regulator n=1 Tax=Hellea balneolensis TaxID=287478 RepID=A0A7C5QPV6_9PROT|nr:TetR/AcrR family transcriptional regulator [Hellea balneolensis]
MARTQAPDFNDKCAIITKHAAGLFAEKGFAGASVSDLAKKCNISKSLIYHYYPSKEAILYAVMTEHIDKLLKVVDSVDLEAPDKRAEFKSLTRALLKQYGGAAKKQKVLLYELDFLPKPMRKDIVHKQRQIIDTVHTLLMNCAPEGSLDDDLARTKTMLFFGMINWTNTWFKSKGKMSREALADQATETILKSLK